MVKRLSSAVSDTLSLCSAHRLSDFGQVTQILLALIFTQIISFPKHFKYEQLSSYMQSTQLPSVSLLPFLPLHFYRSGQAEITGVNKEGEGRTSLGFSCSDICIKCYGIGHHSEGTKPYLPIPLEGWCTVCRPLMLKHVSF